MSVKVKVDFDKAPADKALQEVQDSAGNRFKELGKIAAESLKFEKIKAGLEGLKSFSEELGPLMDDAEKGTAKTFTQMAKLGDAGFKLGASIHPVVGLVTGAIGAIGGYFVAAAQKKAELKKKLDELKVQAQESKDKLAEMDNVTFGAVTAEIDKFRDALKRGGQEAAKAKEVVKELLNIGSNNLADAFDAAAESADRAKEATIAILKPVELSAQEAKDAINENADAIRQIKAAIVEEANAIKNASFTSVQAQETYLASQEKYLGKLKAQLADYTKAQTDAAAALKKAIDQEVKDDEAAAEKKKAARQKADEDQVKSWAKAREAKAKEDEKWAKDILERENRWHEEAKAAEEWAETVKRVTYETNLARLDASYQLQQSMKEEAKVRAEELAKMQADQAAASQELADSLTKALQPLGTIVAATFGKITDNIEKGNKAMKGVGLAAKGAIAEVLKSFAKQWGAQALAEVAAGIASLALGPVGAVPAAGHFAAAAGYGAAAAVAGVGGAVISKNVAASSAAQSSGSSSQAPSSGGGSPFTGNKGGIPGGTIIVQMNGNLFMGSGDERSLEEPGRNLGRALGVASAVDQRIAA